MPRVYVRKFDWDEARTRHAAGETFLSIAESYGVTINAIRFACNDEERQRQARRNAEHQRSGICRDCGATGVTRHIGRCTRCAGIARTINVRPRELKCVSCHQWKLDADFPSNRSEARRRGKHTSCRACLTRLKREYRRRVKASAAVPDAITAVGA